SISIMALRAGEPMTIDTGPAVFQRLGLTGKIVKPVKVNQNDERGAKKNRLAKLGTRADYARIVKADSAKRGSRNDATTDYDSIAYSGEDNESDDESDVSTELVPADVVPTTRSGRAVKPSKRRDYDFDKLYNHKKKSSNNAVEASKDKIR
ncbi:hypothetical protein FRC01_009013, partial [Tulasnella sp. 417]